MRRFFLLSLRGEGVGGLMLFVVLVLRFVWIFFLFIAFKEDVVVN